MGWSAVIANGLAWFLVWLFAQAAWHKFATPRFYRQLMAQYLGRAGSKVAVRLVAAIEAGVALVLLISQWRCAGLVAAAAMLLIYSSLMASRLWQGDAGIQCGCSGPDSELVLSWALVMRNGACAVLALLALVAGDTSGPGWPGGLVSMLIAAVLIFGYVICELIISQAQWMAGEG